MRSTPNAEKEEEAMEYDRGAFLYKIGAPMALKKTAMRVLRLRASEIRDV
jgi:hypothetical protein